MAAKREGWEKGLVLNPDPNEMEQNSSPVVYRTRGRIDF